MKTTSTPKTVSPRVLSDPAQEALRISESRYRRLFETAQDGILLLNADTAQIEDVNPYLIDMLGYTHTEFLGKKLWEVGAFSDRAESKEMFAALQANGFVRYEHLPLKSKTGARVDVEFISNTYDVEGIKVIQCNIRSIADRVRADAKTRRYAHLYAALSECNKAVLHCESEQELFLQICRAAVQFGGMKMAWIGLVDRDTLKVHPVASFGDDSGYCRDLEVSSSPATPFGQGPTGIAIRENRPYWCQDLLNASETKPWRERAVLAELAASASLPLHRNGEVIGVFTLYAAETQAFDELARRLLLEMATDIGFALDRLALQAMHKQANEDIALKNMIIQTQMETSLDAILVVDENAKIISCNQQFGKLWRIPPELLSAGADEPVLHAVMQQVDNPEIFAARVQHLYKHRDEKSRDDIQLKDGRLVDRYSAPVTGEDGTYYGRVWYFRDITEQKRAEKELLIAATAFEVQEGIIITDSRNTILRVNKAFSRLTGYSADEAVGQTPALLKSGMQDAKFYKQMWESLTSNHYWQGELWDRHKNGDAHPYWVTITAVTNAEGEITHFVSAHSDLTKQKKYETAIHTLAFYDPLTHLPNRRLLFERLEYALAASEWHHDYGAVLFVDLDNFKFLNDTRGHNIGDQWLIEVAKRLQACVGPEDTVARLGGDEFVIILKQLRAEALDAVNRAHVICDEILETISQVFSLEDYEYQASASIGICLFRGQELSADVLLKRADSAMYQAKGAGRNTVRFYDPVMQAALEARAALESDLRHALAEHEFVLHYQAQIDNDNRILGAEALIRWQHPERGMVSPAEFIPQAERSGLIIAIGQWVLETACAQLKIWEADPATCEAYISVNVSASQFHQNYFVERVRQTLHNHGVNPTRLKLELTESLILDNVDDCIAKMQELKDAGVTFSMDDFGTGYSSLSYLTQLPLDQLKIDQSFVHHMNESHSDAVIVQTIIGMSHSLGIEVLAEGVETDEQHAFLEKNACDQYQGYLFHRPEPIAEFQKRLIESFLHS
ncbi:MAG: EAL domain-containing protein [Rhodanobacteraceae bacterium]